MSCDHWSRRGIHHWTGCGVTTGQGVTFITGQGVVGPLVKAWHSSLDRVWCDHWSRRDIHHWTGCRGTTGQGVTFMTFTGQGVVGGCRGTTGQPLVKAWHSSLDRVSWDHWSRRDIHYWTGCRGTTGQGVTFITGQGVVWQGVTFITGQGVVWPLVKAWHSLLDRVSWDHWSRRDIHYWTGCCGTTGQGVTFITGQGVVWPLVKAWHSSLDRVSCDHWSRRDIHHCLKWNQSLKIIQVGLKWCATYHGNSGLKPNMHESKFEYFTAAFVSSTNINDYKNKNDKNNK